MKQEEIETLKERVIAVLKTIYDPEIPIDIWTLHLIYGVDVDAEGNVKITMTVTAPNCPVAETLPAEVQIKVQAVMGVKSVDVELTFDPVWSRPRLTLASTGNMAVLLPQISCIKGCRNSSANPSPCRGT